jgi:hypothetical protein
MHPQLQRVADELAAAQARLHRLASAIPPEHWSRRPEPDRWSVAECVAHLNLTSAACQPLLEQAIARGRRLGGRPPARYRRDPIGWILWRLAGPPVKRRVKTTPPFVPRATASTAETVAEFDQWRKCQLNLLGRADGLPLGRIWITSPFDARLRYNTYACLTILPRHDHRHLWQAEQAWAALSPSVLTPQT